MVTSKSKKKMRMEFFKCLLGISEKLYIPIGSYTDFLYKLSVAEITPRFVSVDKYFQNSFKK